MREVLTELTSDVEENTAKLDLPLRLFRAADCREEEEDEDALNEEERASARAERDERRAFCSACFCALAAARERR